LGFGTRGRLGSLGRLGNLGSPLPAYWTLVAPTFDVTLSVGVLHSPGPARARIVAAIEQIACIAVSFLVRETRGEGKALHLLVATFRQ
jgi:hypothetical protein